MSIQIVLGEHFPTITCQLGMQNKRMFVLSNNWNALVTIGATIRREFTVTLMHRETQRGHECVTMGTLDMGLWGLVCRLIS